MARISGVDIPREKRLEISLTYIFGIGRTTSQQVCDGVGISRDTRVRDLTDEEVAQLRTFVDANLKVEGDLRREIAANIKRKVEIGSYEGLRHRRGLPVHGQRTRTNARTRKGPKKTVAGRKKARKSHRSAVWSGARGDQSERSERWSSPASERLSPRASRRTARRRERARDMAKPAPGGRRPKRRERKNVAYGTA